MIDEMEAPRALGGDRGRARRSLLVAGAGLATGGLTLLGQAALDAEWNRLANSGAIWLAVAFAVGSRMASDREASVAGSATLLFALVGYELAARVTGASISVAGLVIWSGTALVGGPVLGFAGQRWGVGAQRGRVLALPVLLGRDGRERVASLALLVPLACVGFVAFEMINRLFLAG